MSEIVFLTGQPLGYYRSWSLFSFLHHYIVWLATKYAYPKRTAPYFDYALLGDDILITELKVAEQYRKLLDRLGVTISESKSIIFDNGIIKFAKRSWKRSNVVYDLVLFGLIWKCYDMGAGWDITTTPRWLLDPATFIQFDRWILGEFSGTDFLMAPVDLPSLVKGCRTSEFRGNRTQVKLSQVYFALLLSGIHCQSLLNLPGPIALLLPSNRNLAHRAGAGTLWKMRELACCTNLS
ncbi:hypothetical protein BC332_16733 [Capsicum chinense]|nr:hypothetical protein BC332_16733 [Capsicum chinense]